MLPFLAFKRVLLPLNSRAPPSASRRVPSRITVMSTSSAKSTEGDAKTDSEALSPLTPFEERRYGALGLKMQYFHNHLQEEYEMSYELADGSFNNRGMHLTEFLDSVDQFRNHLTLHHDIEEAHVFPLLAKRMAVFRENERHKNSHKLIHDGLDKLEAIVHEFRLSPSSYSPTRMREALDSFREPLYTHLAEEVRDLSAENMRKHWSLQEIGRMHF